LDGRAQARDVRSDDGAQAQRLRSRGAAALTNRTLQTLFEDRAHGSSRTLPSSRHRFKGVAKGRSRGLFSLADRLSVGLEQGGQEMRDHETVEVTLRPRHEAAVEDLGRRRVEMADLRQGPLQALERGIPQTRLQVVRVEGIE